VRGEEQDLPFSKKKFSSFLNFDEELFDEMKMNTFVL
jgi:hypothetical protein